MRRVVAAAYALGTAAIAVVLMSTQVNAWQCDFLTGGGFIYVNGAKGTLEVRRDGRFRVPVNLFRREPGLYTIMLWLKRNEKEPSFPATQICIRCE